MNIINDSLVLCIHESTNVMELRHLFFGAHILKLFFPIFSDLSPEQQKRLLEIRKKKHELLLEIQVSEFHFHFFIITAESLNCLICTNR